MAHNTKVPDDGDVVKMNDGREGGVDLNEDPVFIEDDAWQVSVSFEDEDGDEQTEQDISVVWDDKGLVWREVE